MKRILLIGTGGTIASEMKGGGLAPELTSSQLLSYVPDISKFCHVDCIQPYSIDSTDLEPKLWQTLAGLIEENYAAYDGFVITHGTDTMAYTAAALSYLVQNSAKPIVITGAQKPIGSPVSDSRKNMLDAFCCASSDNIKGVVITFNGRVIRGTRARKTRTKSFEAFESINYPDIASVMDGRLISYIKGEVNAPVTFYKNIENRVGLMKLIPGMDSAQMEWMLSRCDVLIIESFGTGGLPHSMRSKINDCIGDKTVILTTQVQNEGSDIGVYNVGNVIKDTPGILQAWDMTTECVVAKSMWILGLEGGKENFERLFYIPVNYDILKTEQ